MCGMGSSLNERSTFNCTCVSPSYSSLDTEDVGFMDSFDVVLAEVANLLRRTKAHCASGLDGILRPFGPLSGSYNQELYLPVCFPMDLLLLHQI